VSSVHVGFARFDADIYSEFAPEVTIFRKRQEIIAKLQNEIEPGIFNPRSLYDGDRLLYSERQLHLRQGNEGIVRPVFICTLWPYIAFQFVVPIGRNQAVGQKGVYCLKIARSKAESISVRLSITVFFLTRASQIPSAI
jgi:hypothetical protein